MRSSRGFHIWLLACVSNLQVSKSFRIRKGVTADHFNASAASKLLRSAVTQLRYPQDYKQQPKPTSNPSLVDYRQQPKPTSDPSLNQKILLWGVLMILLLIFGALVLIAHRLYVSSHEKGTADQPVDDLARSNSKDQLAKQEAEASDILPDDRVQWMWGDASNSANSVSFGSLSRRDLLRWSRWKRLNPTIVDLAKFKDSQNADRPVEMRTRRAREILFFDSVDEAMAALQEQAEAATILPDDTLQWMWGDASPMASHSIQKGHSFSARDPLRWSRWNPVGATIANLTKFKDARHANRPVEMRSRRTMITLNFENVDEALDALRETPRTPDEA